MSALPTPAAPGEPGAPLRGTPERPVRVAVLASGSGTNLQALLDHADAHAARCAYRVALVVANRADAGALARAESRGIPTVVLGDPADAGELDGALVSHGAELVVLAGYLKLVPAAVTRRYRGRMLNVHPALLPAFGGPGMYGRRVHAAVLAAGARVSGPTVHFVDEAYDRGAIAAQWPVPVLDGDTPEGLAERVLAVEHLLLPRVVDRLAAGHLALDAEGRAAGAFAADVPPRVAFALQPDPGRVAESVDAALAP